MPPSEIDASAAWERLRDAIERRFVAPGPDADAEVARLRDELVEAMGEKPMSAEIIKFTPHRRRAA